MGAVSTVAIAPEAQPTRRPTPLQLAAPGEGLLERAELQATLGRLLTKRVTIISAPAGSGKTSLLRAWAGSAEHDVAFVSVERERAEEQLFWRSVLDALGEPSARARGEKAGGPGEKAGGDRRFDADNLIDRVLAGLGDRTEPVVLVIDDLHELLSSDVLGQLERVLASLPRSARVILSSRRDPRLRLHRLRLAGEVGEIRARELRFTESETREVLRSSGVALSDEDAAALWARTEGWAAGVRLAAISLAAHPDPDRFVDEFSGGDRAVGEYLLAEMLEHQPTEVQRMLLRTSIVSRVNGELADLLAERSESERVLLELEDANAFVVSLDQQRSWFRYHQLLADFLRLELRRTLAEEVPELHRRAAGWFADHGQVLDAVQHLLAAGDWPEAARLLADHVVSLSLEGRQGEIASLLRLFPPGASSDDPDLALAYAASRLAQGRLEEAAAHLALAETHLGGTSPERRRRVESAIVSSRLALARRAGRFAEVTDRVEQLGFAGVGGPTDIGLGSDLRGTALMNLGIVEMWSGRLARAERHLSQGAQLARTIDRPYLELACRAHLGFASTLQSFSTARERCREALAVAERHGWDDRPLIAPALGTLAGTSILMGELDEGERWLQRAWKSVEHNLDPANGVLLHLVAGMLYVALGEEQRSLEELELAEESQALVEDEHVLAPLVSAWLASTLARLGRVEQARAFLGTIPPGRADTGEIRAARATLGFAEGDAGAALEEAQAALHGTSTVMGAYTLVEANLIAGLAHLELGSRAEAKVAAEAALAAAEPDRLMLPFVVTDSLRLLEAVPPQDTAHRALLIEVRELLGGAPTGPPRREWVGPPDPLSPSELRVLRYLPTNLTRPEIAQELYVSINTVNTHIRNIYAKLGARGRSSAVERARELQLLAAGRSR